MSEEGRLEKLFPVVILAGGVASRLRPITEKIPKCLVPVNGTPFLDIQLKQLRAQGIQEVILLIGHLGDLVADYVGRGSRYGLRVSVIKDGPQLLGTGGALRSAMNHLPEEFFLLYGDSYLSCSYEEVQQKYIEGRPPILMTVFKNDGRWDVSNIEYSEGVVVRYSKKVRVPTMNFIDYGLMILQRDIFSLMAPDQPFDLSDVLEKFAQNGQVMGLEIHERFYEIGSHSGLQELSSFLCLDERRE